MPEGMIVANLQNSFLSVVIPAYDEENRIIASIERILEYFRTKNIFYEIIIVDDGSKDDTCRRVEGFTKDKDVNVKLIRSEVHKGKGSAVRKGVLSSGGQYVLLTDADLSTPIEEFEKMFASAQEGYDIVCGSRALDSSLLKVHQPWYREIMGKIFNFLVQGLIMRGIRDTQCGFKLFKKDAITRILRYCVIERFAFDVEIIYIAKRLGYKIKELPVIWFDHKYSKVHIVRDSLRMLFDLVRIRTNIVCKRYP